MKEKEKLRLEQTIKELKETVIRLRNANRHHYADEIEELITENERLMKTSE